MATLPLYISLYEISTRQCPATHGIILQFTNFSSKESLVALKIDQLPKRAYEQMLFNSFETHIEPHYRVCESTYRDIIDTAKSIITQSIECDTAR